MFIIILSKNIQKNIQISFVAHAYQESEWYVTLFFNDNKGVLSVMVCMSHDNKMAFCMLMLVCHTDLFARKKNRLAYYINIFF